MADDSELEKLANLYVCADCEKAFPREKVRLYIGPIFEKFKDKYLCVDCYFPKMELDAEFLEITGSGLDTKLKSEPEKNE